MPHSHTEFSPNSNFENTRNSVIIAMLKKLDRVVIASLIILTSIWVFTPDQLWPTIGFVGENLWEIFPYLLISVLLAGYIKATGADRLIGAAFRANANAAIMVAALVGAFSPFCSCGVVPLIAALLASGVPLAPVMAFLMASPIIDPQMAILTAGVLGTEFAIAKIASAVFIGLMGGYLVVVIQKMGGFENFLSKEVKASCGTGSVTDTSKPKWRFWQVEGRTRDFLKESKSTTWFLGKWLSVAFILEGLMIANIPMDQVGSWLASVGSWAIPAAALVGVPAYMNGYAGIPLADALMQMGLPPSAALSFMVAGGVTCIPAAVAVKALVKTSVFLTYLGVAAVGSISVGFLYAGWLLII